MAEQRSKFMEKEFVTFLKFMLAVVPSRLKSKWRLDPSGLGSQQCLDVLLAEYFCMPLGRSWHMGVLLANAKACLRQKSDLWVCLIICTYILSTGSNNCYSPTRSPDATNKSSSRHLL